MHTGRGSRYRALVPDYTMIMLDGLPLIGRTTGILDLSRITTNNIDKIEIVKGPVSSLIWQRGHGRGYQYYIGYTAVGWHRAAFRQGMVQIKMPISL
jgi:hypothetical protein